MNHRHLSELLDYHYWAQERVFDACASLTPEQFTRDLGSSFKSVRDTLSHLYSADRGWYQVWQSGSLTAMPTSDQRSDFDVIRREWSEHETKVRAFLNSLSDADVNRVIEFRTPNGATMGYAIGQMVQHLVNHGSYHRGQLTTMFRLLGAEPASSMDLIRYYREQSAGTRE